MSYSRWSYSDWYTFGHSGYPRPTLAVWSRFEANPSKNYSEEDIRDALARNDYEAFGTGEEEERGEFLREVFHEWLDDIDDERKDQ